MLPFWEEHSIDGEYGGFFTCLLRDGQVYDTDKFIWLQARQVWTFSKLYNDLRKENVWLEIALGGADFLEKYGRDKNHNWYFSLTRQGDPLVAPYNIFSDCFACMAFGQLYLATGEAKYASISIQTFQNILNRQEQPKGKFEKRMTNTRPMKGFALPMILANLCLEIEHLLDSDTLNKTLDQCQDIILTKFYREDLGIIVESISSDDALVDSMEGRLLNPGHAIEACWFLMDVGRRNNDMQLINKATKIALQMIELGWDQEHSGIFYFLDRKGHPMEQLEWDQKLWWVHLESLVAMIKGYAFSGNEECLQWFEKLHEYSWNKFHDPEFGEWFGYLKRDGTRLNDAKGGKWKGCFHVPRALLQCIQTLDILR